MLSSFHWLDQMVFETFKLVRIPSHCKQGVMLVRIKCGSYCVFECFGTVFDFVFFCPCHQVDINYPRHIVHRVVWVVIEQLKLNVHQYSFLGRACSASCLRQRFLAALRLSLRAVVGLV